MKKFLRGRKNSQTQESKPAVSAPVRLAPVPAPIPSEAAPDTPLYARFATTTPDSRPQDAQSKPFVQEPRGLSSKTSSSRFSLRSSGGQDRQSRVLSRKSSRQEQVQSKPTVLTNPPTLSSSRVAPPPVLKQEPARVSSTAFPRTSSYEDARPVQGLYAPPPPPAMDHNSSYMHLPPSRPRTDSSGSESYAPPRRPLVVRNGGPETSSTTSFSESAVSKAAPPVPALPTPASPPTQYSRLNHTGFAPEDPSVQASRSYQQQPALRPAAGASRSRYPTVEPSSSTSYTPSRPTYNDHHHTPPAEPIPQAGPSAQPLPQVPQAAPQRATSLLSTPSVTRRKYSPMAAFGLPVAASTSMATSSSMQTEAVSSIPFRCWSVGTPCNGRVSGSCGGLVYALVLAGVISAGRHAALHVGRAGYEGLGHARGVVRRSKMAPSTCQEFEDAHLRWILPGTV